MHDIEAKGGYWTTREIFQQTEVWGKIDQLLDSEKVEIDAWLSNLFANNDLRLILSGAGTSAYIGDVLAPHLTRRLLRPVEAISTTELVANPEQYLLRQIPTLLISYARSGNSPESLAALQLADQVVDHCYHLIITCNKEGELFKFSKHHSKSYCILMPEESLDQSFAMTSSYTIMIMTTLAIFADDKQQRNGAIEATRYLFDNLLDSIKKQAQIPFGRIVFLGSGSLLGTATEAALKMLELSAGKIDCYAESPLGFRHGPKSIVDHNTMIILLNSSDPYCAQYDKDLLNELIKDDKTKYIISLNDKQLFSDLCLSDVWLTFPYIVYCQLLALYKSLALGHTPDNPCPSGEVNRVVQGVTIYPLEVNS